MSFLVHSAPQTTPLSCFVKCLIFRKFFQISDYFFSFAESYFNELMYIFDAASFSLVLRA